MNNIKKYLFALLVSVFAVSACTDFVDPAIPYSDFETGVFLRTLKAPATTVKLTELAGYNFSVQVEVVDETGGTLVQDVDLFVKRRRGNTFSEEKLIKNTPASAFGPNPDRNFPLAPDRDYPAATITASLSEILGAMGMTIDDLTGGDFFEFRLELHDTKGRTFTNTNLSGDVAGGTFYASPFFYRIGIVCVSELGGTYDLSTAGWCGDTYTGKVKFVPDAAGSPIYTIQVDLDGTFVDDFSFGSYRACYGAATAPPAGASGLRMNDSCNQLAFNDKGSAPWGDNFFVEEVAVSGAVLTLKIRSSWDTGGGVFEGGTATITRTDGTNWPALKK